MAFQRMIWNRCSRHLTSAEVLGFRDSAFLEYYKNPKYLAMVEDKFGLSTREDIEKMTEIKLKRKILGD